MTDTKEAPVTDRFYKLEYRIVYIDRNENRVEASFHEPGKVGFGNIEAAQNAIAYLMKADAMLGEERLYEIEPVMVSEKYQQFDQNIIFHDGSDEEEGFPPPDLELPPITGGGSAN